MRTVFNPLWKYWFLPLGLAVVVAIVAGYERAPTYESRARLLFKLGDEFLQAAAGPDARTTGRILLNEAINSDVQILTSHDQYRSVVEELGVDSFRGAGSDEATPFGAEDAIRSLRAGLDVKSVENSAVIHMTYKHADPDRAQHVLETLIDVYFRERDNILRPTQVSVLETIREDASERYQRARQAHADALAGDSTQDIESTLNLLRRQQMALAADIRDTRRQLIADGRRRDVIDAEIAAQPSVKELYSEPSINFSLDRAKNRLVELQLEANELLAKYTETSRPVSAVRGEIRELERIISAGESSGDRVLRRTGSNPIRDELQQQRIQLNISIAGAESRLAILSEQEADVRSELATLGQRFNETDRLRQEFELADSRFRAVDAQLLEHRIFSDTLAAKDANVRVIENPTFPTAAVGLSTATRALLGALIGFLAGWLAAIWIELSKSVGKRGTGTPSRQDPRLEVDELDQLAYIRARQGALAGQRERRGGQGLTVLGEFGTVPGAGR